jgi:hypothetical protein
MTFTEDAAVLGTDYEHNGIFQLASKGPDNAEEESFSELPDWFSRSQIFGIHYFNESEIWFGTDAFVSNDPTIPNSPSAVCLLDRANSALTVVASALGPDQIPQLPPLVESIDLPHGEFNQLSEDVRGTIPTDFPYIFALLMQSRGPTDVVRIARQP